jgi:hypothetical protein
MDEVVASEVSSRLFRVGEAEGVSTNTTRGRERERRKGTHNLAAVSGMPRFYALSAVRVQALA